MAIDFQLTDEEREFSNATNRLNNQQFRQALVTPDQVQRGFRSAADTAKNVGNFLVASPGEGGFLDVLSGNTPSGGLPAFGRAASDQINRIGSAIGGAAFDATYTPPAPTPASALRSGRETGRNISLLTDAQAQRALNNTAPGTGAIYQSGPGGLGQFRRTTNADAPPLIGNINPETGVPFDIENLRAANAIRQQTIDSLPKGSGIKVVNSTGLGLSNEERAARAAQSRLDTGDIVARNRAFRLQELENERAGLAGRLALGREQIAFDQAALAAGAPGRQAARLNALAGAASDIASTDQTLITQNRAAEAAQAAYQLSGDGTEANAILKNAGLQPIYPEANANGGLIESFADGGYVDPTRQMNLGTGAIGQFGAQGGNMQAMQRYTEYATKAREMNLPLMGFDEFQQMAGPEKFGMGGMIPAQKYAMGGMVEGFADGGSVDASGAMVIDPDPNAPTDSIPAVIDGNRPAALDSGEFVMPKAAVMFYGTDKLNKMVEKAMGGGSNNGGQQSAIAQFGGAGAS